MNRPDFESVTDCIILAGGEGRRMGGPKALLEVNGSTLIERQFQLLSPLFDNMFVSLKDVSILDKTSPLPWQETIADPPGARCLLDVIGNAIGKIGRPVFLAAVDVPALNRSIVSEICSQHSKEQSVVPVDEKRPQPLAAVWDPAALEVLEPPDEDLALLAWVRRTGAILLKWPDDFPLSSTENQRPEHPFRNLNTPEDLREMESQE